MARKLELKKPETTAGHLIPERLRYLLEERPLLWCEDAAQYDALFGELFAELDPKGIIETLLVKDVVDYLWEIRRLRQVKVAALHVELPAAAGALLEKSFSRAVLDMNIQNIRHTVFAALDGGSRETEEIQSRMSDMHVTPQMLLYEAFKSGLSTVSAIDASIARMERRRDLMLKQISERRQAFGAMAKSLVAREEAELVEADQGGPHE